MLSSGMKCYYLELMLSSGANVIIWDEMLSCGMKCYHLELMLSSGTKYCHWGWNVIIWDAMLLSGANVIIWDKMLSSGANVIMVSFGGNVIIWCYHVMLSAGMITHPFFIFHSLILQGLIPIFVEFFFHLPVHCLSFCSIVADVPEKMSNLMTSMIRFQNLTI